MKKVVVIEPGYLDYKEEMNVLSEHISDVLAIKETASIEEIKAAVKDTNAILIREAVVNKEIIDAAPLCQVIVRYGVGVDNVDLEYAKAKNIYVANVPDYGSEDVAEHALALLVASTRRIVTRDKDVHQGKWNIGQLEPIPRMVGKTLGIIGFGRIARCFYNKTSGIGFGQVLVFDPALTPQQAEEFGVTLVSIDELCQKSDFISLHVPLLPSTHHMIDAEKLDKMKPGTVIVNSSRGGLIDEQALYNALKLNKIYAAGLDVFEQEPVDLNNPLLSLPNVICTDHTAWFTQESVIELQHKAAQEVLRVFNGGEPIHWVNK